MRTFFTILKNDYYRTVPRILSTIILTVITLASMVFAVYVTDTQKVKIHIAFAAQSVLDVPPKGSEAFKVTILTGSPLKSELVKRKYDAFVIPDGTGGYEIETLRNQKFREMLTRLLQDPLANVKDGEAERGVGVNILGYMMMFVLMMSFSSMFAFADDKEQGQLRRISAAPTSFGGYLAAHFVYGLSLILPEYILLIIMKAFGWNVGFSLVQYAGLITVLGALGISFALLLNTCFQKPDQASMLGNGVTVLTTILAGSFYEFHKNHTILETTIKWLPQKEYMNFAQQLQNGGVWYSSGSLFYVIGFSVLLFAVSCVALHSMYVKKG